MAFSRPSILASCGLLLLGTAAQAQNSPAPIAPAVPAPVVPMPPAPAVPAAPAPTVQTVLSLAVAAHKALTAFSATVDVQSTGGGNDSSQTIALAFQNGEGAKATVTDKTGPRVQIVSDGKTLTTYDLDTKQYLTQPLTAARTAEFGVFNATGILLPMMMSHPDGLLENLSGHGLASVLSAGMVGTTPVDVITLQLPVAAGGPKAVIALSIGQDDHLLRKFTENVTLTRNGQPQTLTHTETISDLTLTPTLTAGDFAFTPPAGAKKAPPQAAEPPMYDPRLKPGARPFAVAASDLSGKPLNLSQYRGKVVLMDFWATWCGPCVGEMPNVIAAYKKYHARGFDVVGISLDQDKSALTSFIAQNKMPWRQVYDGKGWGSAVPGQYGVRAIPFGLLLNRDGTIAAVEVRGDALPAAIKVALAKK